MGLQSKVVSFLGRPLPLLGAGSGDALFCLCRSFSYWCVLSFPSRPLFETLSDVIALEAAPSFLLSVISSAISVTLRFSDALTSSLLPLALHLALVYYERHQSIHDWISSSVRSSLFAAIIILIFFVGQR